MRLAMDPSLDPAFEIRGPTFIQPTKHSSAMIKEALHIPHGMIRGRNQMATDIFCINSRHGLSNGASRQAIRLTNVPN